MLRLSSITILFVLIGLVAVSAEGWPATHAVLEIRPELFAELARAAEYPYQIVRYDGGDARAILPQKSTLGMGETGHLKKLDLFLRGPEDVNLSFQAQPTADGRLMPVALLEMRLHGPAQAEWWAKLPLDSRWRMVKSFKRDITLFIRTPAIITVLKRKHRSPRVGLVFEKVTRENVELNVKGAPPWLDSVLEGWFNVCDHVNRHISQEIAAKTQLDLPSLSVPFSRKCLILAEVRPQVVEGVLRVELAVGSE
ncbi:MAG: hypothetical protein ACUVX8_16585 [Candidatus Zipacnadales bacterium]